MSDLISQMLRFQGQDLGGALRDGGKGHWSPVRGHLGDREDIGDGGTGDRNQSWGHPGQ